MSYLTFDQLRNANRLRISQFKNSRGGLAHTMYDGSDWSPAQWLQAVVGELGEYANFRKKFERGDIDLSEFQIHAGKELADVQIYLDILAMRCLDTPFGATYNGVDLGQATIHKFNERSCRIGCGVSL
jgi:NTP pyrophosphatase (non-canonical NTP hydrolase)